MSYAYKIKIKKIFKGKIHKTLIVVYEWVMRDTLVLRIKMKTIKHSVKAVTLYYLFQSNNQVK